MTKIAFAPIAILAVMVFTWVVAAWATYQEGPQDGYDYEDEHSSAPPHVEDSEKEKNASKAA
ncbi:MAG: hypothetical protein EPO02_07225 [Nitrospirae bacterium]|nr:MAG: hypothetical protein EPO02_07225 [Nitrospirota bacterium]